MPEIKKVLNKSYRQSTALFLVSYYDRKNVIELLLTEGADPNVASNEGAANPLYLASQNGYINIVRILLSSGADPNIAANNGATPLHLACYIGFEEIVKLLLKCNANTKAVFQGQNITDAAMAGKHYAIAEFLESFIDGDIKYAPKECPSHPDYVEDTVNVGVMGEVH